MHERTSPQLIEVEIGVAELQETRAELVLVRVAVLLDEAVGLQGLEQPVHRRARHSQTAGDLAHPQPAWAAGQDLQDSRRAIDRLDRRAASWLDRVTHSSRRHTRAP